MAVIRLLLAVALLGLLVGAEPAVGQAPSPAPAAAAQAEPERRGFHRPRRGEEVERLRGVYRAAYLRFAAGEREAAAADLAAAEAAVLALDAESIDWLERAEMTWLVPLAIEAPPTLVPLAVLYGDLFQEHLRGRRYVLAHRAAEVAEALLERAAKAGDAGERERCAAGFDALAAEFLRGQMIQHATAALERTVAFVPDRTASRLALAVLLEKEHRFDLARGHLDALLRTAPDHREGRLRRARILGVQGDLARSAAELETLLGGAEADWVAVVAAQERARQLLAQGDLAGARALLERASARFPDEASLTIALAWTHLRTGARAQALADVGRASRARRADGTSPRRRYAETNSTALGAARGAFETVAAARLDDLAAAIGRVAEP